MNGKKRRGGAWRRSPWLRVTALALALTGAFVACDDEDPAGPGEDEAAVEALVTDDPSSTTPSVGSVASASSVAAQVITGSATGDARVDISVDGTEWIELGSMSALDVDLQSTDQASVSGETMVPVGSYGRVRLVLDGAAAHVLAGSDVGGIVVNVDATVTVGGGGQVILERAVAFEVSADTKTLIVFDLNAEQWITQATLTAGTATEAEVDASVTANARLATG